MKSGTASFMMKLLSRATYESYLRSLGVVLICFGVAGVGIVNTFGALAI
jgi:hypothetical protein